MEGVGGVASLVVACLVVIDGYGCGERVEVAGCQGAKTTDSSGSGSSQARNRRRDTTLLLVPAGDCSTSRYL